MTTHTPESSQEHEWLIPEEGRKHLQELFGALKQTVQLEVYTPADSQNEFESFTRNFALDLARLSERIVTSFHPLDGERAKNYAVTLSPTILVNPADYRIRFTGAPMGEEARALIETIFLVSVGASGLSSTSLQLLEELTEQRNPRVFTSPGCPYCPGQFVNAVRCAIAKPDLVSAECVTADEFPDLSKQYGVGSVPHTVFSETYSGIGLMPEERFVLELVDLKDAEAAMKDRGIEPQRAADSAAGQPASAEQYDILVLGAGPAGLTAGIYAERSGLTSLVLDKSIVGGQVATTPTVENYPGFAKVGGLQLVEILAAHTREYANIHTNEPVVEIKLGKRVEVYTATALYTGRALIFATGSQWRSLGVPGEQDYFGTGVSHCASCDGYAFRGKRVLVVGGGNSALTDALHLKNLGADVTIAHRRDSFRAEKALQDAVQREGIPVLWDTAVEAIVGNGDTVTGTTLRNLKNNETVTHPCDGVFVAIGYTPNTALAAEIGVALHDDGTIRVDANMRTNIPRIYAAGDVTGGVRQIVTAVGAGATAALSAFEDLQHPYWKR